MLVPLVSHQKHLLHLLLEDGWYSSQVLHISKAQDSKGLNTLKKIYFDKSQSHLYFLIVVGSLN